MKNKLIPFYLIVISILMACGGENSQSKEQEDNSDRIESKTLEELNLAEHGYNLSIMVPKSYMNDAAKVKLNERGVLEVVVGLDFGIEIMHGNGDLELLKTDLEEDLVYKSELIHEDENALVYTQEIPDSGVKIQNHFLYKTTINGNTYEVKDIPTRAYSSGMIDAMLESARTLKAAP